MKFLLEMAMSRQDAIIKCDTLGQQFIEHFKKIIHNPNSSAKNHWISEMQNWLNTINKIVLKHNNKQLSHANKMDWFFTVGSSYDILFNNEEDAEKYDRFVLELEEGNDIKTSFESILGV